MESDAAAIARKSKIAERQDRAAARNAARYSSKSAKKSVIYRYLSIWIRGTAVVGLVGLVALSSLIVIDVLLRWLFSAPVYGAADIYRLLIICVIAAFFPLVILERQNVEIRLVGRLAGPRLATIADTFGQLCALLFLTIAVWQCARHAVRVSDQITPVLELPIAPVWWLACTFLCSAIPAQLLILLNRTPQMDRKK